MGIIADYYRAQLAECERRVANQFLVEHHQKLAVYYAKVVADLEAESASLPAAHTEEGK